MEEFCFVDSLIPFTAFDETGIVGFFTLRNPDESLDELRFGFVIVNPHMRGKSYGKAMLQLGLKFAFENKKTKKYHWVFLRIIFQPITVIKQSVLAM